MSPYLTTVGQPDNPKEPQVSFAILTANENERKAVTHFLKLGKPIDTTKFKFADGRVWSNDAFLEEKRAKIEPHADNRKKPYDVFCLEVGQEKHMGVHVSCNTMGPWGALHETVELLKTAKDQGWKLRCIFLVGCCGACVSERKDCPRGTILLARQVKDYLNTGKVVNGEVSGNPLIHDMGDQWMKEWEDVQGADRQNPHKIEMQRVNYLTGPLVIKDDLFGKTYCEAKAKVTGVEMEVVGVIEAVKIFCQISGGPEVKVVLAKGVSDYTGKKGEKGTCTFFGTETHPVDDDSLQVYATLQSIALVIRFVANNMWIFE